ncbi:putative ribonuclease H-like domain-containing protein [Tanacetum coccineum]
MALMTFSDSEVTNDKSCSKSCLKNYEALKKQYDDLLVKLDDISFKASTYKRGLSILEGQILKYKESEVLFFEEIALLKRSIGHKEYQMGLLRTELEKVKEEKEGPTSLDLSYSGLEEFKQPEENTDDYLKQQQKTDSKTSSLKVDKDWKEKFLCPANQVREEAPKKARENNYAPIIEDWVSDDEDDVESIPKVDKKTVIHTATKKDYVKPETTNGTTLSRCKGTSEESNALQYNAWVSQFKNSNKLVKENLTEDETSEILKNFIKEVENLVDKKVKIIRSDNGTEFKNKVMDEFCREKGTFSNDFAGTSYLVMLYQIIVEDAQIEEKDELQIRMMQQKKSLDGSNLQNNGTADQQLNTARQEVNIGSREVSTALPEVNIATPEDLVGPSSASEDSHMEDQEIELGNIPQSYEVPITPHTRIHKDHPIEHVIGDVQSSVQTRRMKTSYSEKGFLRRNQKEFPALRDPAWVKAMQEELLHFKLQKVLDSCRFYSKGQEQYGTQLMSTETRKMKGGFVIRNKARLLLKDIPQEDGIDSEKSLQPWPSCMVRVKRRYRCSQPPGFGRSYHPESPISIQPDISCICACARLNFLLKTSHLLAVKRIFRYLKGKPSLGLWYSKDSPLELVAYTDSDYAGATQDRKSTTRGCQFLGNRLISWQCKKQTVVATSTTEAEYVAATSCCG